MKYRYLVIYCEDGRIEGTDDRKVAEWYSNGDYTLVYDTENAVIIFGNEDLSLFDEREISEARIYESGDFE